MAYKDQGGSDFLSVGTQLTYSYTVARTKQGTVTATIYRVGSDVKIDEDKFVSLHAAYGWVDEKLSTFLRE